MLRLVEPTGGMLPLLVCDCRARRLDDVSLLLCDSSTPPMPVRCCLRSVAADGMTTCYSLPLGDSSLPLR
jgi:hypothetical protein